MSFNYTEEDINEIIKNGDVVKKSKDISDEIQRKQIDITRFIDILGFALISTDAEIRLNATMLLSETLSNLSIDFLSETQLNFIITFYCDRITDHHSILPAVITGILSIVKMKNIPSALIQKLLKTFFDNVPCQSQVKNDREKIFEIFKILSETRKPELIAMGSDFIYGIINAIDGERDPRLLLFLFDFMPMFIKTFPLHHLSEEMFEIFACYFPIDFNPSPNDPAPITRDILSEKLILCLCASKDFTESCLNLLLEKLESNLFVAKMDSLNLLAKCSEHFTNDDINKHFEVIWTNLKVELLPGTNQEITFTALITLETIIKNCSKMLEKSDKIPSPNSFTSCDNILKIIYASISTPLSDTDSKLFTPATAIILIAARASSYTSFKITDKFLPLFLNRLQDYDVVDDDDDDGNTIKDSDLIDENKITQKCTLIDLITRLLIISQKNNILNELDRKYIEASHSEFIKYLLNRTNNNNNNNNNNLIKYEELLNASLLALIKLVDTISLENRKLIYLIIKYFLKISDTGIDSSDNIDRQQLVSKSLLINIKQILITFSIKYPSEIQNEIINKILIINFYENLQITNTLFDIMITLINIDEFHDIILKLLLNNIFIDDTDDHDLVKQYQLQMYALKNLRLLLETSDNNNNPSIFHELYNKYELIDKLYNYVHKRKNNLTDDLLMEISLILRLICKSIDISEQNEIINKYLPSLNLKLTNDLYLISGLLGYLEKSVNLENHFENIAMDLTKLAIESEDEKIHEICHHLLCSLFNKLPDTEQHKTILQKIIKYLRNEIEKHNKKAIKILSWISKGLLTSGHADGAEIISTIIDLLEHPTLATTAVLAFEIISLEVPGLHLPIVKHLFQQKFFHFFLKKLSKKITDFTEHHLNAFTFVLKMTPHIVLKMNIEKIGPIVFKCLKLNDVRSLQITLDIIERFLTDLNEYFRDHLQHLIPTCLELCKFQDSMKIRISAIRCLKIITKYPTFMLLPYKHDVVYGLIKPLDDPKRLVRNAAVETRNLWFLVGADDGINDTTK